MVTVVWSMFLPGHMSHHSHFGDPQDICTIGDAAVMGRDCGYTLFFFSYTWSHTKGNSSILPFA